MDRPTRTRDDWQWRNLPAIAPRGSTQGGSTQYSASAGRVYGASRGRNRLQQYRSQYLGKDGRSHQCGNAEVPRNGDCWTGRRRAYDLGCLWAVSSKHMVQVLNFLDVGEAKQFFTALDQQQPDVALLDMPGASGKQTREQIQKFGLFQIAKQLGYRTTIATVLNNAYNTVNSLDIMLGFCGENADCVVIKSQLWNQGSLTFDRWQNSQTRTKFRQLKGIEIEMPVLELTSFDALHEESLSFFEREQLSFGDRVLVDSFLDLSQSQLQAASTYFGITTATEKKLTPTVKTGTES